MDRSESAPIGGQPLSAAAVGGPRQYADPANEIADLRSQLAAARSEMGQVRDALTAAREREAILAHELQRRVRNMLATIRSIYRRTRESGASQEDFADHFQGRLEAVARYHLQVEGATGAGVDLEDMVRNELLEAHGSDDPGCTIGGPPVRLHRKAAEMMSLAVHELTTNSIKFGALAYSGRLAVEWSVTGANDGAAGGMLRFCWNETGFGVISPTPRRVGFGRQLIEEALPYQLEATTSFRLIPGGVECVILLPIADIGAVPDGLDGSTIDDTPVLPSDEERSR